MASSNEKSKVFFRLSMQTHHHYSDNQLYAIATVHIYKSYAWDCDTCRHSNLIATLEFISQPLDNTVEYRSKNISQIQPQNFGCVVLPEDTAKFVSWSQTSCNLQTTRSLDETLQITKDVSALIAKVKKVAETYNLSYVHKDDDLGLFAYALLKAGVRQVYTGASYYDDLIHTGDKTFVWSLA